ncbi:carboxylesterase/lipase family protein [Amycolatopsis sp. CA-230715]|uniref:carboxylesterase/lipase family protein n=1 Tax=Amycolatopsis sp. CA-230715 TaxID=2745196 RepID=UPI001C0322A3|nr:carboxylesterase family protein [Amycolatopsis sp. CA-230715]QWF86040.1 Para-nitrobenzyl esterase [Amycolatopsis sp. CA-230715]
MDTTSEPPRVRVVEGVLRGCRQAGAAAFFGVPFAAPPVGPARFRPPEPPLPWPGVRDAARPGPAASQGPSRLAHVLGDRTLEQSEDCLTLNVWTPEPDGPPRPVLVFLHGGGFTTGSGGLEWYRGAELARRGDIVVVTTNYRLGALGFSYLDEGNLGVRDQIQALRWVRDNIAAFHGDPGAVTVAGQSGGALSILAMLSGTTGRGLFHRAILQSTPAGMRPQTTEVAETRTAELLSVLGLRRDEAGKLRAVPVEDLLDAQREVTRRNAPLLGPEPPFQLVADTSTVAADPVEEVGGRGADGIPVIIGTTRDEAGAFHPGGDRGAAVTESLFRAPMIRFAELLAEHGNPAWVYQFDWSPAGSPFGACHCIELPFVLGNPRAWADAPMLAGAGPSTLVAVTDLVQPTWIALARHGNPCHEAIPDWPAYRPGEAAVLHLSTTPTVQKGQR